MSAVAGGDRLQVERHASALRRLDERVHAEEEAANDYRRAWQRPARRAARCWCPRSSMTTEDDDEDDVEVMFGRPPTPTTSPTTSGKTRHELEPDDEHRGRPTRDEFEARGRGRSSRRTELEDELETELEDETEAEPTWPRTRTRTSRGRGRGVDGEPQLDLVDDRPPATSRPRST